MNRAMHAVAMLGFLMHLLLGCCLHHAHGERPDGNRSVALAETCHPDGEERRDGHDGDGCCHRGHPAHRACHEASCPFVRPDDPASASQLAGGYAPAPGFCDVYRSDSLVPSGIGAAEVADGDPFPPARTHLLYQILLI